MQCPYCNKENFISDRVERSIESYGSSFVRFKCKHCNNVVKAYGKVTVRFSDIRKTNEEDDWG